MYVYRFFALGRALTPESLDVAEIWIISQSEGACHYLLFLPFFSVVQVLSSLPVLPTGDSADPCARPGQRPGATGHKCSPGSTSPGVCPRPASTSIPRKTLPTSYLLWGRRGKESGRGSLWQAAWALCLAFCLAFFFCLSVWLVVCLYICLSACLFVFYSCLSASKCLSVIMLIIFILLFLCEPITSYVTPILSVSHFPAYLWLSFCLAVGQFD